MALKSFSLGFGRRPRWTARQRPHRGNRAQTPTKQSPSACWVGRSRLALNGKNVDRYGRRRAHAFLNESDGGGWLQAYLVGLGHARVDVETLAAPCAASLLQIEKQARGATPGTLGPRRLSTEGSLSNARTPSLSQHVSDCRWYSAQGHKSPVSPVHQLRQKLAYGLYGGPSRPPGAQKHVWKPPSI